MIVVKIITREFKEGDIMSYEILKTLHGNFYDCQIFLVVTEYPEDLAFCAPLGKLIFVTPALFHYFTPKEIEFIVLHEIGHVQLEGIRSLDKYYSITNDEHLLEELKADTFAYFHTGPELALHTLQKIKKLQYKFIKKGFIEDIEESAWEERIKNIKELEGQENPNFQTLSLTERKILKKSLRSGYHYLEWNKDNYKQFNIL